MAGVEFQSRNKLLTVNGIVFIEDIARLKFAAPRPPDKDQAKVNIYLIFTKCVQ